MRETTGCSEENFGWNSTPKTNHRDVSRNCRAFFLDMRLRRLDPSDTCLLNDQAIHGVLSLALSLYLQFCCSFYSRAGSIDFLAQYCPDVTGETWLFPSQAYPSSKVPLCCFSCACAAFPLWRVFPACVLGEGLGKINRQKKATKTRMVKQRLVLFKLSHINGSESASCWPRF